MSYKDELFGVLYFIKFFRYTNPNKPLCISDIFKILDNNKSNIIRLKNIKKNK